MARQYLERDQLCQAPNTVIVNGVPITFSDICVHEFSMGDVEDPDIYAAEPIFAWQNTEAGQWIMEHSVEPPYWLRHADMISFGYKYKIIARLSHKDQVFWKLKYSK